MFGAKYSRLKFWIISIILLIIALPILIAKDVFKNSGNVETILIIASAEILIIFNTFGKYSRFWLVKNWTITILQILVKLFPSNDVKYLLYRQEY